VHINKPAPLTQELALESVHAGHNLSDMKAMKDRWMRQVAFDYLFSFPLPHDQGWHQFA